MPLKLVSCFGMESNHQHGSTTVEHLPTCGAESRHGLKSMMRHRLIKAAADVQDATVRLEAVSALLSLYSEEANLGQLHEITVRFKTRFTELPNDIDEDVALKGVSVQTGAGTGMINH